MIAIGISFIFGTACGARFSKKINILTLDIYEDFLARISTVMKQNNEFNSSSNFCYVDDIDYDPDPNS